MLKKSQISIDFLIVAGAVLVIFAFVFSVVSDRRNELFGSEKLYSAKGAAENVAASINTVFLSGSGTRKTFYTPNYLRGNTPYTITIYPQNHLVEIKWEERSYTSTILTSNIAGGLSLAGGNNLVENINGLVQITAGYTELCGNSVIDAGEDCDGNELGGETCISQGYSSGILACNPDCTFDFSRCYTCGNNIAEGTEICDGTDLRGESCISQGYAGGVLGCLGDCSAYDTSGCTSVTTCQNACSALGFGSWQCRNSCSGGWANSAPEGDAYCSPQVCCCR